MAGVPTDGRRKPWPWIVLALVFVPAVWHVFDFEHEPDGEFPNVARPTFSAYPPAAYRLAEPGDTLDRVGLYVSAAGVVFAAGAWLSRRLSERTNGLWPSALVLSLAACWYTANPGPTFDGWHGLGWSSILNAEAPLSLRLVLAVAAVGVIGVIVGNVASYWTRRRDGLVEARRQGYFGLLVVAALLIGFRQVEVPGIGPPGYWPRWGFILGMLAFDFALMRAWPSWPSRRLVRWSLAVGSAGAWLGLVSIGLWLIWFHRPLERLRTVVPGKIYMSAMPTYEGLEIAQKRHHFKTILNLFPEDTDERSPLLPEELRFVREHEIRYLRSPVGVEEADRFLEQTLNIAQDPEAWPILVHCHGCMDRTPAWVGIYKFTVLKQPLDEILREIEQHRGYRPKASVTLLYNRVLRPRATAHYDRRPDGQAAPRVCPWYHRSLLSPTESRATSRTGRDAGVEHPQDEVTSFPLSRDPEDPIRRLTPTETGRLPDLDRWAWIDRVVQALYRILKNSQ